MRLYVDGKSLFSNFLRVSLGRVVMELPSKYSVSSDFKFSIDSGRVVSLLSYKRSISSYVKFPSDSGRVEIELYPKSS